MVMFAGGEVYVNNLIDVLFDGGYDEVDFG